MYFTFPLLLLVNDSEETPAFVERYMEQNTTINKHGGRPQLATVDTLWR